MFQLTETVRVERPTAEVWAVLEDFPKVPAWERDVLEVRQTSPGRPGIGTTLVARRVYGPRQSVVDCRIVEWEDDRSVTMEIVGGPTRRTFARYAVEPIDENACLVTYSVKGDMQPLLSWLTPIIPAVGRRLVRTNLASLKRLTEDAPTAKTSMP